MESLPAPDEHAASSEFEWSSDPRWGGGFPVQRSVFLAAILTAVPIAAAQEAQPRMGVLLWGDDSHGQCQAPALSSDAKHVLVACGTSHSLALQSDGHLLAWGADDYGQLAIPVPPRGQSWHYQRIAASDHNLALLDDGTLQAWGRNDFGQCEVPILPRGVVWAAISAGARHSAALRSDGAIECWGDDSSGQCDVPKPPLGRSYVAVSAGARHTVALRSDGRAISWGDNSLKQCSVPPEVAVQQLVAISAGGGHTLALSASGRLVAWGSNESLQCAVPARPYGREFVEIAAGGRHSLARLDDGSVLCWGANDLGQCTPPKKLAGFEAVRIAAGAQHSVVLFQAYTPDVWPVCLGNGSSGPCPCRNDAPPDAISGCVNSSKHGAALAGTGQPRLRNDEFGLFATGVPATIALVLQGRADPTSGSGSLDRSALGDGLFCLSGPVRRLGTVHVAGGNFAFPDVGTPPLPVLGGLAGPGEVFYQVWFRDPSPLCRGDGSNTSNGLRVIWSL
jgi:hypothetical protein